MRKFSSLKLDSFKLDRATLAGHAWYAVQRHKLIAAAFAVASAVLVSHAGDVVVWSDGMDVGRQGNLFKFSNKGIWPCVSWEGQLATEGYQTDGNGGMSNIFSFTVRHPAVRDQLIAIGNDHNPDRPLRINLGYHQTFTHWSCARATDYWVDKVTVLGRMESAPATPSAPAPH